MGWQRWSLMGIFWVSALPAGGCSETDFGDVRVPAEQQHVIKADAPVAPLNLPADHPFAIHIKKSSQNPGVDGRARGESNATPAGEALCLAEAGNGGSASAEFNIGHRIDNRSSAGQQVGIQVEFALKQSVTASTQPAGDTLANANLFLVVMDGRKQVLAKVAIVQGTSDQSAGEGSTQDQRTLSVRFEPQQSYDVMLYGKVNAGSAANQEAKARLEIGQLKMQLSFSPAATQPAAK